MAKILLWNLRVVGGAGACGGDLSFGLRAERQQQRSVLLSGVSDGEPVRDTESSSGAKILGPFSGFGFGTFPGGGCVLKTIEHVSRGVRERTSGQTSCEKPFPVDRAS